MSGSQKVTINPVAGSSAVVPVPMSMQDDEFDDACSIAGVDPFNLQGEALARFPFRSVDEVYSDTEASPDPKRGRGGDGQKKKRGRTKSLTKSSKTGQGEISKDARKDMETYHRNFLREFNTRVGVEGLKMQHEKEKANAQLKYDGEKASAEFKFKEMQAELEKIKKKMQEDADEMSRRKKEMDDKAKEDADMIQRVKEANIAIQAKMQETVQSHSTELSRVKAHGESEFSKMLSEKDLDLKKAQFAADFEIARLQENKKIEFKQMRLEADIEFEKFKTEYEKAHRGKESRQEQTNTGFEDQCVGASAKIEGGESHNTGFGNGRDRNGTGKGFNAEWDQKFGQDGDEGMWEDEHQSHGQEDQHDTGNRGQGNGYAHSYTGYQHKDASANRSQGPTSRYGGPLPYNPSLDARVVKGQKGGGRTDVKDVIQSKPTRDMFKDIKFPAFEQDNNGKSLQAFCDFLGDIESIIAMISHNHGAEFVKRVRSHVIKIHQRWTSMSPGERAVNVVMNADLEDAHIMLDRFITPFILERMRADERSTLTESCKDEEVPVNMTRILFNVLENIMVGTPDQITRLSLLTLKFPTVKSVNAIKVAVSKWEKQVEMAQAYNGYSQQPSVLFSVMIAALKSFVDGASFETKLEISAYRSSHGLANNGSWNGNGDHIKRIMDYGKYIAGLLKFDAQANQSNRTIGNSFAFNADDQGAQGGPNEVWQDGHVDQEHYNSAQGYAAFEQVPFEPNGDQAYAAFRGNQKGKGKGKGKNRAGSFPPRPPPPRTQRVRGTIARWNKNSPFGFILPSAPDISKYAKDATIYRGDKASWLYVNKRDMVNAQGAAEGEVCTFEVVKGNKPNDTGRDNLKAVRVKIEGSPTVPKTGNIADAKCTNCGKSGHFPDQCDERAPNSPSPPPPVLYAGSAVIDTNDEESQAAYAALEMEEQMGDHQGGQDHAEKILFAEDACANNNAQHGHENQIGGEHDSLFPDFH